MLEALHGSADSEAQGEQIQGQETNNSKEKSQGTDDPHAESERTVLPSSPKTRTGKKTVKIKGKASCNIEVSCLSED